MMGENRDENEELTGVTFCKAVEATVRTLLFTPRWEITEKFLCEGMTLYLIEKREKKSILLLYGE